MYEGVGKMKETKELKLVLISPVLIGMINLRCAKNPLSAKPTRTPPHAQQEKKRKEKTWRGGREGKPAD